MIMTENNCSQPLGASRSIYYSLTDEVPGLTEAEKNKLECVMKKALEFEEEEVKIMRQPYEGVLYKYTNVMKGWQYRWFTLTPDTGMLEYYMAEDRKKSKPRGGMHLAGAVVVISEEDNLSFVVNAMYGDVYKLKANDAKERQFWVDKIRFAIEKCSSHTPEVQKSDQTQIQSSFVFCKSNSVISSNEELQQHATSLNQMYSNSPDASRSSDIKTNSLTEISESVSKALECQKFLAKSIEDLPISGSAIKCSDNRLLLIKAISQATVQSLEQCYLILRRRKQAYMPSPNREIKNPPFILNWRL